VLNDLKFIARRISECRRNSRLRVFFVDRFKAKPSCFMSGILACLARTGKPASRGRFADLPQASLKAPLHVLNLLLAANIEVVDPVVAGFEADCN